MSGSSKLRERKAKKRGGIKLHVESHDDRLIQLIALLKINLRVAIL